MADAHVALGFDVGEVRTGVAVGNTQSGTVRPLCVLHSRQQQPDWEGIARLIGEWQPSVCVVGVPRHLDETESAMTKTALRFGRQLQGRFGVPVHTIDEHLSSWEAEQQAFAQSTARRRVATQRLDAQAAAVILETWLHTVNTPEGTSA